MSNGHHDDRRRYEIRLAGHLDDRWAARFDGMGLTHEGDGTTVIRGCVADQAALHGVLRTVRDLGVPLLSLAQVDPDPPAAAPADPRRPDDAEETVMTTTGRTATDAAAKDAAATAPLRRTAFLAGALYLITFAASIPAAFFFLDPVLSDPGYVVGAGADTRVLVGGLLDVVNAFACVGTAVVLFPVVKRQDESLALGFVTSRVLEAAIILIGVVSLFAVVTLRQELAGTPGTDDATLLPVGAALVAVRDWTFLLGPGVMAAVNALLLGTLVYRSGLVPRVIPLMGLVGAPLLLAAQVATVFGVDDGTGPWSALAVAPIFFWELALGVWLVVKGFRPSPITTGSASSTGRDIAPPRA